MPAPRVRRPAAVWGAVLALAVFVSSAACSGGAVAGSSSGSELSAQAQGGGVRTVQAFDRQAVAFGALLDRIEARLLVAAELVERGQGAAASAQARTITPFVSRAADVADPYDPLAAQELARVAHKVVSRVDSGAAPARLASALATFRKTALEAERAVVPDASQPAYEALVVGDTLENAAAAYRAAVKETTVVDTRAYQEAYGLLTVAQTSYRDLAFEVESSYPYAARRIEDLLSRLADAIPSLHLPQGAQPAHEVDTEAAIVSHLLSQTFGFVEEDELDPQLIVEDMGVMLTKARLDYHNGNRERAIAELNEAYRDYGKIQGAVAELSVEVNDQLSQLLGDEVQQRLEEGASPAEIDSMMSEVFGLLSAAGDSLREDE
ncbi:MAG TPA: hypothetical protein VE975_07755 [Actinomycetota bacterium]|nr:hypothetical protein [Actinomycetota bacterium]